VIKLAVLLKRKNGMTFEEFDRYWRDQYGDLIGSISDFTRHVRRYSQSHIIDPSYGGEGLKWPRAEFDGIAEFWFESIAEMNRAFSEPKFVEEVGTDYAHFVEKASIMVTEEVEKVPPNGEAGVKLSVVMRRREGMSFGDFDKYWLHNHGDLVLSVSEFTRHLRRYVQSHVVPDYSPADSGSALLNEWGAADFDGIAELWFDDIPGIVAAFNEPRCLEIIGPDDARFIDVPRTELMTVREIDKLPLHGKTAAV
jgi:uncharacterized protein (TIGR02118 family)